MHQSGIIELPPVININMDNFKPYDSVSELRRKANDYLLSLRNQEFSLEESNPNIKFYITKYGSEHTTRLSGPHKLIALGQLPDIFKQANIWEVQDDRKGRPNMERVLICRTYILIEGILYEFEFKLKMERNSKTLFYDGSLAINMPEHKKTA